ncbi:triphosphoribosyl-dephospho-CoA synthase [Streptomyces sp. NPDC050400]|uniref:triphosphoribosyl-dephospho-CoA synthase n=1 Tax=Streptomyces sp. NPDC050400 TaxID=3365610 RepID=UPI0037876B00
MPPTPRPAAAPHPPVAFGTAPPEELADLAVDAITQEIFLAPKPGLLDPRAHAPTSAAFRSLAGTGDLLREAFLDAAEAGADIGRLDAACRRAQGAVPQVASDDGLDRASRVLCLLVAGCAHGADGVTDACRLALDLGREVEPTGALAHDYPLSTAEKEACLRLTQVLLPTLAAARSRGVAEETVQLDALLTYISWLEDDRVLREHGPLALRMIQRDAAAVLAAGGTGSTDGRHLLRDMDESARHYGIRPAGSGALLPALLFLGLMTPPQNLERAA